MKHFRHIGTVEVSTPFMLFAVKLDLQDVRSGFRASRDGCFFGLWLEDAELNWTPDMVKTVKLEEVEEFPAPRSLCWPEFGDQKIIHHLTRYYRPCIWRNPQVNLYSKPQESRAEFLERCRDELAEERHTAWRKLKDVLLRRQLELQKRMMEMVMKEESDDSMRDRRIGAVNDLFSILSREWIQKLLSHGGAIEEEVPPVSQVDPDLQEMVGSFRKELVRYYNEIHKKFESRIVAVEPYEVVLVYSQIEIFFRGFLWR